MYDFQIVWAIAITQSFKKPGNLFKMAGILVGFQMRWTRAIAQPFENQTPKCSVFKCVRYSDPHRTSEYSGDLNN